MLTLRCFIDTTLTYSLTRGLLRRSLVFLLLLVSAALSAQKSVIQEADQLVQEKRYKEAAILYKKAYDKKKDKALILKLGDVNFLNENYPLAQTYYAEYFSDSIYQDVPEFLNYAKTAKLNGNIKLASRLYYKVYAEKQDASAKSFYDMYKLYLDTALKIRAFNLDSNYSCIQLDAGESLDALASPMIYEWTFEDSTTTEGLSFEHCFTEGGIHKVVLSVRDQQTGLLRQNDTTFTIYTESSPVKFTSPKRGNRYLPVKFDASATTFYFNDIIDYLWDMDNGDIVSGKKMEYRYKNFGTYNVRLTVITKDKNTGKLELFSAIRRIEINENYMPK